MPLTLTETDAELLSVRTLGEKGGTISLAASVNFGFCDVTGMRETRIGLRDRMLKFLRQLTTELLDSLSRERMRCNSSMMFSFRSLG